MKVSRNFILVMLLLFFAFCKSKQTNYEDVYNGIEVEDIVINAPIYDSILVSQKIIEPKELILPVLDSIIQTLNHCPAPFRDFEMPLKVWISVSIQDSQTFMYIGTIFFRQGRNANAIFNYKSYDFTYSGVVLEKFFYDTGEFVEKKYADLSNVLIDIDDRAYEWRFIIDNSKIKGLFVKNCDFAWSHELFDSLWVY